MYLLFEGPSFLARKLVKSLCFSNSLIIGKHKFNFKRIIKRLYYYCPVINMWFSTASAIDLLF